MLEQPIGDDDLVRHAALQRRMKSPLRLDESITSLGRAQDMIELGGGRIVNIKPGRVGGYTVAKAIHDLYWHRDVVTPEWTMDGDGMVRVPRDRPGLGVTVDRECRRHTWRTSCRFNRLHGPEAGG